MKTFTVTLTVSVEDDDFTNSEDIAEEVESTLLDFSGLEVDSCYAEEVTE